MTNTESPTLAEDLAIGCQLVEQKNAEGIFQYQR